MPEDSFLRFDDPEKRERLLPILHRLYEFESEKISGSHGGFKRFSQCIWTKEEAVNSITEKHNLDVQDVGEKIEELIQEMSDVEKRHMLRFKIKDVFHHITRVAEMIRTTGNLHEYSDRDVSGQDSKKYRIFEGTRWEPRLRFSAKREITKQEIIQRVLDNFSSSHLLPKEMGNLSLAEAITDLKRVLDSIEKLNKFNGNLKFTEFQARAIVTALRQSWASDTNSSMVITAGTGMGKTLSFAIPVITDALIANRIEGRVCSQLLMYPRNALAKDQFSEIQEYVKRVNNSLIRDGEEERCLGIAIDADGLIKNKKNLFPATVNGSPTWNVGNKNVFESASELYGKTKPASIIACSIESFRRRLRYPEVVSGLKKGLRRIVFDEIHLSSGTQGAHHSKLVSRCRQLIFDFDNRERNKNMNFIGVSATIAKPRYHVSKISGVPASVFVDHVDASSEEMDNNAPLGILHHILVRPRVGTPTNGALVDLTSAVTHQRRSRNFHERESGGTQAPQIMEKLQKTIGFADSHEVVGTWHSLLRDNESTGRDKRRTISGPHQNRRVRRPYAHWHERPLQIQTDGASVCESCQNMNHHSNPINISKDDINKFIEFTDGNLNGEHSRWNIPLYENDERESFNVTGLETCPHLEVGTCWWFSPREDTFEGRPGDLGYQSFQQVIRSSRYTGKTKPESDSTDGKASANFAFSQKPRKGAYERLLARDEIDEDRPIPHDIAIATPTLEVGVDMDNVSEVITHKAIRNISSYRQKVGRAGREPGSDSVAITMMAMGNSDFQHYRSMNRLIDTDIVDPVPIAVNNLSVKKNQAYEAVFDYLAKEGFDLESIPTLQKQNVGEPRYSEWKGMGENIRNAIKFICELDENDEPVSIKGPKCDNHILYATGIEDNEIRENAAIVVAKHLRMFLEKTLEGSQVIQWLASMKANRKLVAPLPEGNKELWEDRIPQFLKAIKATPMENPDFWNCFKLVEEAFNERDVEKIKKESKKLKQLDQSNDSNVIILELLCNDLKPQMKEHELCRQVENITDSARRHYLSSVMEECPIFRRDTPFSPLPTLFENPHETPVIVNTDWGSIDMITNKEALKYTLPGMWTHRLGRGQRFFVKHGGDVNISDDETFYRMQLDGQDIEHLGKLSDEEIEVIPELMDLSPSTNINLYKIISLEVSYDNGGGGQFGASNMIGTGRDPYKGLFFDNFGNGDVTLGIPNQMLRPRSHSISWVLSELSQVKEKLMQIETYRVKNTIPAQENTPQSFKVTEHPLLNTIFEDIIYDSDMKVKRIAFGVSRSNGPLLAPAVNHQNIGLVDEISTNGIRFYLKNDIIQKLKEKAIDINHPFDERILRMLGSWILSRNDIFNTKSYRVKEYLEILVQESWRLSNNVTEAEEFPKTNKEFMNLLFRSGKSFEPSIFERRARRSSITTDEQLSDIADELRGLHSRFTTYYNKIYENFEEEISNWYCSTLLNTLGLLMAEGVSEIAGVQGGSVAYTYNTDNLSIDVFDDDAEGNGSIELAKEYFHIPIEIRELAEHFGDMKLPSSSFSEILERRMQICQEHILHEISISKISIPNRTPNWMKKEITELRGRYEKEWDKVGARNTREARLHNLRKFSLDLENRTDELDYEMALSLCSVECPSCSGSGYTNLFPPHLEDFGTCRAVLDEILGDWTEKLGYLKQFADRNELSLLSGENVPSNRYVNIKSNKTNSLASLKHFVQYPSPPIAYSWNRGMEIPNEIDFLVRHMEII